MKKGSKTLLNLPVSHITPIAMTAMMTHRINLSNVIFPSSMI